MRPHDQRVLSRDAVRDGVTHHRVDVTVLGDVFRLAVVGAERHPRRTELGNERHECAKVPRGGSLPDQEPHPGPQPLPSFLGREGLVVGADSG